jgi:hypothetical protein
MTAEQQIGPPDDPIEQTANEILGAEGLRWKSECLQHRADKQVRDAAAAAALARELDRDNPARDYQTVFAACLAVGLKGKSDYKRVSKWYRLGKIYGRDIDDKGHFKICVNDLRDFLNKTGRHR